ncbi:unnamed protein product, partial [Brenthis ino]
MTVKVFFAIMFFALLLQIVVLERISASARAFSHYNSFPSVHQATMHFNMAKRMKDLETRINAMKEKHLQQHKDMMKRMNQLRKQMNQEHNEESFPHNELSHTLKPVTVQPVSNYHSDLTQIKTPATEIKNTSEQIFHDPKKQDAKNDVLNTFTIPPTLAPQSDFTETKRPTEENANTITEQPFKNQNENILHPLNNISMDTVNSKDSAVEDFDIDIRDGFIYNSTKNVNPGLKINPLIIEFL